MTNNVMKKIGPTIWMLNLHIIFDGNYYDHNDGVAIGLLLGIVLANLFMDFYKYQWLK